MNGVASLALAVFAIMQPAAVRDGSMSYGAVLWILAAYSAACSLIWVWLVHRVRVEAYAECNLSWSGTVDKIKLAASNNLKRAAREQSASVQQLGVRVAELSQSQVEAQNLWGAERSTLEADLEAARSEVELLRTKLATPEAVRPHVEGLGALRVHAQTMGSVSGLVAYHRLVIVIGAGKESRAMRSGFANAMLNFLGDAPDRAGASLRPDEFIEHCLSVGLLSEHEVHDVGGVVIGHETALSDDGFRVAQYTPSAM